uniref:Ribosome maturation factor RimM n=1 Tax=Candidatus Kentrum sp. TUN TaxID=2126343 RepID=A0A450ZGZ2_9GAMM|nr:MAG: 16S rRNA processing protein RimM [Candidatus Kentron sp. TUN]VFK53804.1 MAG: 16S rRNA processing protein RimM [Candidatus Kentron sp. TUN]VFK59534.1 MAG: 16S rRNA processing protein RimM [Candidatus Kentron sp. TUN]
MQKQITIGRINGVYGIYGWVKVHSFTVPVDNILGYSPWELRLPDGKGDGEVVVIDGRRYGNGCLAKLASCQDRDAALRLVGANIVIARDRLPSIGEGEYYWDDLIGCRVITRDGIDFGHVNRLMETGANDVLVVKGERVRLVPFVFGDVILAVDLKDRIIRVDWDAEF